MENVIIRKIENLLMRQSCVGATKSEEIACFKRAILLTLKYNITEVDLDALIRHLYTLDNEITFN